MGKKIQSEIDVLFARRNERLRRQTAESEQRRTKEEEFIAAFGKLRAEVVKPVLQELSDYVNGKGLNASVGESEETQDSEGRTRAASISIAFMPAGQAVTLAPLNILTCPSTLRGLRCR